MWPLWSAHQPTTCGRQGSCHLPSGMWRIRHPAAACWWSPVHCRAKHTSPCSIGGLACSVVRKGPTCAPCLSSMSVPSSALPASVRCHLAGVFHRAGQSRHPTSPGCSTRVTGGTSLPLVPLVCLFWAVCQPQHGKAPPPGGPCFSSHTYIAQNERPASAPQGHPHSPHAPPCAASTHHAPMRGTHAARHHSNSAFHSPGGCQAQAASAASTETQHGRLGERRALLRHRRTTAPRAGMTHTYTSTYATTTNTSLLIGRLGCCTLLLCSSQTRDI